MPAPMLREHQRADEVIELFRRCVLAVLFSWFFAYFVPSVIIAIIAPNVQLPAGACCVCMGVDGLLYLWRGAQEF